MSGGWIAVRAIAYLLESRRGSVNVSQREVPLSSELSRLSIRKILPTMSSLPVGDVDNLVSSRAKNQQPTLICDWASVGVGRTIRFEKSVGVTLEEIVQQLATFAEEHEMMRVNALLTSVVAISVSLLSALPAAAAPFTFNTGAVTNLMAAASRPESAGKFEIESADDFFLSSPTSITSATFTGLLTGGATTANIGEVRIEIYRVFPADSDVARTSGTPNFSTPQVPTRVNSPSDVEFDDRDTAPPPGNLKFTTTLLNSSFTALNSVQPGGIHPLPGLTTGGDKAITGQEVEFAVTFTTPFSLPPDHYFFVPQVEITTASGEFLWLS